jgi:rhodanese-related sulfurtransferase
VDKINLELLEIINQHFKHFDQDFLKLKPCRITPQEVIEKIKNNEKIMILDIRTEYETKLVGYTYSPSLNIPLNKLFEQKSIQKLLEYKDYLIIISCHSGARTLVATAFLHLLGIENTKSLEGGIAAFAEAVKP